MKLLPCAELVKLSPKLEVGMYLEMCMDAAFERRDPLDCREQSLGCRHIAKREKKFLKNKQIGEFYFIAKREKKFLKN